MQVIGFNNVKYHKSFINIPPLFNTSAEVYNQVAV